MLRSSSPFDAEYHYDHYCPSTFASSSVAQPTQQQPRSTSPLNFLYPTMSHHTSSQPQHQHRSSSSSHHAHTLASAHHSSKHQSRAADMSRLLDPAYCSTADTSSAAYIDPHGDLHDPDFRHFPTADRFSRSSSIPPWRRRSSSGTTPRGTSPHGHGHGGYYYSSSRPHWDLALDNEHALLDNDEDEADMDDLDGEGAFFLSHPRYATSRRSSSNASGRPLRTRDSPSFPATTTTTTSAAAAYAGGYSPTYPSPAYPSSTYYSPTTTASTLPTSYESESGNTVLSRCSESPCDGEKKGLLLMPAKKKRRRLSKGDKEKEKLREKEEREHRASFEHSRDLPPPREGEEEDGSVTTEEKKKQAKTDEETEKRRRGEEEEEERDGEERILGRDTAGDYVPTCTQSLRRQWQALSLRFRFGVFRAQRRVMRRVNSML